MNLDLCTDGFHSDECPRCGLTAEERDGPANETNSAVNYGDGVAAERARITAEVKTLSTLVLPTGTYVDVEYVFDAIDEEPDHD